MKKLYQKSELYFALVWIGLYVVVMNIALQFCGGLDDLAGKTAAQMLVPVVVAAAVNENFFSHPKRVAIFVCINNIFFEKLLGCLSDALLYKRVPMVCR